MDGQMDASTMAKMRKALHAVAPKNIWFMDLRADPSVGEQNALLIRNEIT